MNYIICDRGSLKTYPECIRERIRQTRIEEMQRVCFTAHVSGPATRSACSGMTPTERLAFAVHSGEEPASILRWIKAGGTLPDDFWLCVRTPGELAFWMPYLTGEIKKDIIRSLKRQYDASDPDDPDWARDRREIAEMLEMLGA